MKSLDRPVLEGSVAVRDGRRLSFAEYGSRTGSVVVWLHGTPGGRRQIPLEARAYAVTNGLRIIGVDRPGIGSSTRTSTRTSPTGSGTWRRWPTRLGSAR